MPSLTRQFEETYPNLYVKYANRNLYSDLGPAAELDKLRLASAGKGEINRYAWTSSRQHSLKGIRFRFQSFLSATRRYYILFGLRGAPLSLRATRRSSNGDRFPTHRVAFRNYVSYLKRPFFYHDYPATWYTPAPVSITKVLNLTAKDKYSLRNFADISLSAKITNRNKTLRICTSTIPLILSAILVPSEALQTVRAAKCDQLTIPHH